MKYLLLVLITIIKIHSKTEATGDVECWFYYDKEVESKYGCKLSFLQRSNDKKISSSAHIDNQTISDVKLVQLFASDFIPQSLTTLFLNLTSLVIDECSINELKNGDLNYMTNLTFLQLSDTPLQSIAGDSFNGMSRLENLIIFNCSLKYLHPNTFLALKHLDYLELNDNELEFLDGNLFKNNKKLEDIYLSRNKLKIIGHEIFTTLEYLKRINLTDNICINITIPRDNLTVKELINEITDNCWDPVVPGIITAVLIMIILIAIIITCLYFYQQCSSKQYATNEGALSGRPLSSAPLASMENVQI